MKKLTKALRPWTIDFHVAQNDGTVMGSGTHDKTGRHCLATDPNGKLEYCARRRLLAARRRRQGHEEVQTRLLGRLHVPERGHGQPETWNDILAAMIQVRENHGWKE